MKNFLPKKSPKQNRSKDTVESILASVVSLVEQGEPKKITTTQIAEKAGISVGSLYQYFPSKEAIYSALIEFHFRRELDLIQETIDLERDTGSIESSVRAIVGKIVATRKRSLVFERALLQFFSRAGNLEFLREIDSRLVSLIDQFLVGLEARGLVRRTPVTAFLLLHTIRSNLVAFTIQKPEAYRNPEEIEDEMTRMILALLLPKLG